MSHSETGVFSKERQPGTNAVLSHITEIAAPQDVIGLVCAARRAGQPVFYWEKPGEHFAIAAVGSVWQSIAEGPSRFRAITGAVRQLKSILRVDSSSDWMTTPPLLGGFSFGHRAPVGATWRGFAAARIFLPELCIVRRNERAALVRSTEIAANSDIDALARRLAEPSTPWAARTLADESPPTHFEQQSTPSSEAWMRRVRQTVRSVRSGAFDKLVLAGSRRIVANRDFDLETVLRTLRRHEAGCTIFCISGGEADFVGATPETLATLDNGVIETNAIAGTTRRGGNRDDDGALGHALEISDKDRIEHAIVVRGLSDDLTPLCDSIRVAPQPEILRLNNVQHLRTAIRGHLRAERHVLDVVGALHPSAAVGGYPKEVAIEALAAREELERGWYAAPIGWTNVDGDGEFAVALRSGVLRGGVATTFAGAGIVHNSDPHAELAEIDLKFGPMHAALTQSR